MKKYCVLFIILTLLFLPLTAQTQFKIAQQDGTDSFVPLLTAIYAELGISPVFFKLPSERGLVDTNGGVYDADLGRAEGVLGPYPNLMYTKEPIITVDLLAFVKNGSSIAITNAEDLKKYNVGIVRGHKLEESFVAALGLTATVASDPESLAKMLDAGRFDIALANSVTTAQLKTVGMVVGPKLKSVSTFHVLNKNHADIAPKFDAVVKAMKADGRFAKLLAKK